MRIAHPPSLGDREMSARKQYGGGLAVLPCLVIATIAVGLSGCGDKVVTPPTPTPPPPAAVTRVISQGNGPIGRSTVAPIVFITTAAGSLAATVDWTFATNDVDIFLARGAEPCTLQTFNDRSCGFVATEESVLMKPEKLSVPSLAAGAYTLYVANYGDTDESVAYQVTLTSTSASSASAAATATVRRSAEKGTLSRIL